MSRVKLIKQLKKTNFQINLIESEQIIDAFLDCIYNALKNGCEVEIRGFGKLYHKILKENFNARNPATNELLYKPQRVKIRFRASKKLKKIINE